jgi:hypothetical protein
LPIVILVLDSNFAIVKKIEENTTGS